MYSTVIPWAFWKPSTISLRKAGKPGPSTTTLPSRRAASLSRSHSAGFAVTRGALTGWSMTLAADGLAPPAADVAGSGLAAGAGPTVAADRAGAAAGLAAGAAGAQA